MNSNEGHFLHGACTGPCHQSDLPCPCPEACQRAAQEISKVDLWRVLGLGILAASAVVSCFAIAQLVLA